MPITYPISLPTLPGCIKFTWTPDSAVARQPTEFSFRSKVYAWDGQIRRATAEIGVMNSIVQARAWQSAFLKLNGVEGTFLFQDPKAADHRGALTLSTSLAPKVNGAGQNGSDLVTDGWPINVTDMLLEGDYISVNSRLYQLLEDASSNGTGDATLSIWPHARNDLADNADITVGIEAFGLFRLLEWPEFAADVEYFMNGFNFSFEEAI